MWTPLACAGEGGQLQHKPLAAQISLGGFALVVVSKRLQPLGSVLPLDPTGPCKPTSPLAEGGESSHSRFPGCSWSPDVACWHWALPADVLLFPSYPEKLML